MSERMLEADQSRHQQLMESERARNEGQASQMAGFFQTQLQQMQGTQEGTNQRARDDMERERIRHSQEMERERMREAGREKERDERRRQDGKEWEQKATREREEWDRRMDRERQDNDDRRRREEQRTEAGDKERQRQHEMKMTEMEMAAQRDREHAERMMSLSTQKEAQKENGSGFAMLKQGLSFLTDAGIDPKDVLGMLSGGGGGVDWGELIGTFADKVGGVAEKALEAKAEEAKAAAAQSSLPAGYSMVPSAMLSDGMGIPEPGGFDPGLSHYAEPAVQQPYAQPGTGGAPATAENPAPDAAEPATTLGLKAQRTARGAVKQLVSDLHTTPMEEWGTKIMTAIGNEMTIYHYAKDVGVSHAMREGGAQPDMVSAIIDALKNHPHVPTDLRYE